MLTDHLPRQRFCYLPTPLEPLPRLSAAIGADIWIKRDDRSGLSFGGNKGRIFEFVFGDVVQKGCDLVITASGVQSNHLREATAAAIRCGVKSWIVLLGCTGTEAVQGNLLLFDLLGAEVHRLEEKNYFSPALEDKFTELMARARAEGYKPYLQHRSNQTGTMGSVAHVAAAEELEQQFAAQGLKPRWIVVPSGSGSTIAGYILGHKHLASSARVLGIGLSEPNAVSIPSIQRYCELAAEMIGIDTSVESADYTVRDEYIGPGHGVVTPEVKAAIELVARTEGIFLDPTYTGKAMAGLIREVEQGRIRKGEPVVFVHTGGLPALFVQAQALSRTSR
ncbi:MAG: D-cysteine desulfhydrase family protein [Ectothiorhodospiraceae bacterium]|nr:D-cysteine desulfhydrase family protein [Ectothiorhodospiraceae bacterium]